MTISEKRTRDEEEKTLREKRREERRLEKESRRPARPGEESEDADLLKNFFVVTVGLTRPFL